MIALGIALGITLRITARRRSLLAVLEANLVAVRVFLPIRGLRCRFVRRRILLLRFRGPSGFRFAGRGLRRSRCLRRTR